MYFLTLAAEIDDNEYRQYKIRRPDQQVADDIEPAVKAGPATRLPEGAEIRMFK